MIYLGIDPGYANTGVAWFKDSKLLEAITLVNQDHKWATQLENIINILTYPYDPDVIGIEDSGAFGARKGMVGLHKLVGALWMAGINLGCYTYLIQPKDKIKIPKKYAARCKTEHEKDAVSLAMVARKLYNKELKK